MEIAFIPVLSNHVARWSFALANGVAAAAVMAAPADSESGFFEEMPVVLSASRLPQALSEAPAAVTVLDRDFIRATGYRDIALLFRLVPGFSVVRDHAHTPSVSYQGLASSFASNKMQVLIDGRSVYSNYLAGGVDWGGLPVTIDEIDRIEIVRGSSSATYGSNAFLGVINIITRHSAVDSGAMLSVSAGNHAQADAALRVNGHQGDFSVRLSTAHLQDEGFSSLWDDRRSSLATVRADYRLSTRAELTLTAGANSSLRGLGYPGDGGNDARPIDSLQDFIHLRWRYAPNPDEEWSAGYYHNTEHGRELQTYSGPGFSFVADDSRKAHRDNIDFQHYFRPLKNLRLLWGGEARREEVEAAAFFPGSPARSTTVGRIFTNAEWRLVDPLLINVGGLYEKFESEGGRLAPRLFANWRFLPDHTLRAGMLRAYREPSLWEHMGDVEVGPVISIETLGRLQPERVFTREIGYLGKFPALAATLDVRLYHERINDLVILQNRGRDVARLMINSPDPVTIRGIEWQWKARPTESTDLVWSHALTRVDSPSDALRHSAPPYTSSLTWLQRYKGGISSALSLINVGTTEWLDSQPIPSYTTWDGKLSWRFRTGPASSEVAVGLINGGAPHEEWRLPRRPANIADHFWYINLRTEF